MSITIKQVKGDYVILIDLDISVKHVAIPANPVYPQ